MERRRLGTTDLAISRVGFGAWAIGGGGWRGGWGTQDDDESRNALYRALELGVNWVDTAPFYGRGYSEELLGDTLSGLAERPYVFTKCGLRWTPDGNSRIDVRPSSIRSELHDSLRRLRADVLDLYMIHWPPTGPHDQGDLESAWETMLSLQQQGEVRHIGVSNFEKADLGRVQELARVSSLQYPYSLVNRSLEANLLPYCRREQIGVMVWGSMYHGILTGGWTRERLARLPADDWRRHDDKFKEPILSRSLEIGDGIESIARDLKRSPGQVAIAWALRDPAVSGAIVGFRRASQVDELARAADDPLPDMIASRLDSVAPRVSVQVRTF